MKLYINVILHKNFQKYQNNSLRHVTFLMVSSSFKIVIEIAYFYDNRAHWKGDVRKVNISFS